MTLGGNVPLPAKEIKYHGSVTKSSLQFGEPRMRFDWERDELCLADLAKTRNAGLNTSAAFNPDNVEGTLS